MEGKIFPWKLNLDAPQASSLGSNLLSNPVGTWTEGTFVSACEARVTAMANLREFFLAPAPHSLARSVYLPLSLSLLLPSWCCLEPGW